MDGRDESCIQSYGWKILKGRDVWGDPTCKWEGNIKSEM
jgi:hypothetical protein